jgi:t-SNARE complex subunit (syntaxin)
MALIEMLRANGNWEADAAVTAIQVRDRRIEKLEAALRELSTDWDCCAVSKNMKLIARKALEGKDD